MRDDRLQTRSLLEGRHQAPLLRMGKGTNHFGNHHLKEIQGTIVKGINQEPITKTALHLGYKKE